MIYLYTIAPICIFILTYIFGLRKLNKDNLIMKILGVALFVAYGGTLFNNFAVDYVSLENNLFSPFGTIMIIVLKWLITAVAAVAILTPFYNGKAFKKIAEYILPVISILNIVFINSVLKSNFGDNYNYFSNYRTYSYILQTVILICTSFMYIFKKIINKDFKDSKKDIGKMFLVFVLILPAFFQQGFIHVLFGDWVDLTKEFTPIHRITLYFAFTVMILLYGFMRSRSSEEKNLMFATLSMSALFQFFYLNRPGLAALPFHLCNTAVILMFFGFVFKIRGIFYFTYFVNVTGALCAMLFSNVTKNAFTIESVHFWYNHIYAFILPILGVALKVYPRPNLKMIRKAIFIFTLYFLFAAFMNAWLNNYSEVDYFFLYSDFFCDTASFAIPLKWNYILDIPIGDITLRFFYLYQITIYLVYILLMFLTWFVYDYLYQVSDKHYALLQKKRKDKMDVLNLRKELNGRSIKEPIDPEAQNMIKIEHFTKMYGTSKIKSVDDFSLTVNDGEVFGFLGHNGAGKSTTIKSMVGIQSITSGRIEIDGYDIAKQPLEAKLRMGYVSDNHAVYEKLTGREYINYIADLYLVNQKDRDERIEKYVKMFKLEDAIDNEIKQYSHGMKQKIVVIASLIHAPKVWILDEPLTGLDPTSSFEIKECMREHANAGNIVFFSSHVIEVVEKICDRICIISHGKMVGVYSLKDLKEQGISLEQLYMQHVANNK